MPSESTRRLLRRLPRAQAVRRTLFISLLLVLLAAMPAIGQAQVDDIITMQIDAGYGGYFRENYWFPLRISVQNGGDDLTGKLIVRPETSGTVVSNAYGTPIDLPNGASQSVFLYLQARAFPPEVTVELLDEEGHPVVLEELRQRRPVGTNAALAKVVDKVERSRRIGAPAAHERVAAGRAEGVLDVGTPEGEALRG